MASLQQLSFGDWITSRDLPDHRIYKVPIVFIVTCYSARGKIKQLVQLRATVLIYYTSCYCYRNKQCQPQYDLPSDCEHCCDVASLYFPFTVHCVLSTVVKSWARVFLIIDLHEVAIVLADVEVYVQIVMFCRNFILILFRRLVGLPERSQGNCWIVPAPESRLHQSTEARVFSRSPRCAVHQPERRFRFWRCVLAPGSRRNAGTGPRQRRERSWWSRSCVSTVSNRLPDARFTVAGPFDQYRPRAEHRPYRGSDGRTTFGDFSRCSSVSIDRWTGRFERRSFGPRLASAARFASNSWAVAFGNFAAGALRFVRLRHWNLPLVVNYLTRIAHCLQFSPFACIAVTCNRLCFSVTHLGLFSVEFNLSLLWFFFFWRCARRPGQPTMMVTFLEHVGCTYTLLNAANRATWLKLRPITVPNLLRCFWTSTVVLRQMVWMLLPIYRSFLFLPSTSCATEWQRLWRMRVCLSCCMSVYTFLDYLLDLLLIQSESVRGFRWISWLFLELTLNRYVIGTVQNVVYVESQDHVKRLHYAAGRVSVLYSQVNQVCYFPWIILVAPVAAGNNRVAYLTASIE